MRKVHREVKVFQGKEKTSSRRPGRGDQGGTDLVGG